MSRSCKLLTTGRVARLCGFSPSAVLHWIHTGKLGAYSSPGGQYRIRPQELLRFLQEHGMHVPAELVREGAPRRVLIIDDEEAVRNLLRGMLESSGLDCVVDVAESGVVGCMKLSAFKPGLVVLDIVMSEVDGVELCRAVKASGELAATKILAVTGLPEDARLRAALEAGADDWLPKPVHLEPFLTKVATLLGAELPAATQSPRAGAAELPQLQPAV